MKKILSIGLALFALLLATSPTKAAAIWNVTGTWKFNFEYLSSFYEHDAFLTQTGSTITGNGGYPVGGPYAYAWTITSGTINGDQIELFMDYTVGAPGTTMHMTGTIAPDGTISGDWDDNYPAQPTTTRVSTWESSEGSALPALSWGEEVNPGKCDKVGKPVANVTQKVLNSVDSGEGGNNWALDNYNREIQLWATKTPGEYCAVVRYEGMFDGQAAQTSPGAGGTLTGEEDGTFQGGYRATITGTLLGTPLWRTKGFVGTFDYECDIFGNCLHPVNWFEQYFSGGYTYNLDWWGWIYHGGEFGTWVNSIAGNAGDIL